MLISIHSLILFYIRPHVKILGNKFLNNGNEDNNPEELIMDNSFKFFNHYRSWNKIYCTNSNVELNNFGKVYVFFILKL